MNDERMEFGLARSTCGCKACTDPCRFMPGFLLPGDLKRLIPAHISNVLGWCEDHLLASPGGVMMDRRTGKTRNIPTLVLASKSTTDHSCIFLDGNRRCTIHAIAPFGCAFFTVCEPDDDNQPMLSTLGYLEVEKDWNDPDSLYRTIWEHLHQLGKVSPPVDVKRDRMRAGLDAERRSGRPKLPKR